MTLYGTVELGGTKTLVSVGTTAHDMARPLRIPTTTPEEVLDAVIEHLAPKAVDAIGVASFGPLELRRGHPDFGSISTTPKTGWANTPVSSMLTQGLSVPVVMDTDVNGAALGEAKWGAAQGLSSHVYVTVGTGVGGGAVVAGRTIGTLGHPEMGHIEVNRHPGDDYPGRCPYHTDCLEGMASGPAIEDRFGPLAARTDPSAALGIASFYIAQGLRNIVYTLAPERLVVGGGVSRIPGFHDRLRSALGQALGGYPGLPEHLANSFVVAPGLGDHSGLAGGLVLASTAVN